MYQGSVAVMMRPDETPEEHARAINNQAEHYIRCRREYAELRSAYLHNRITIAEYKKLHNMIMQGLGAEAMNALGLLIDRRPRS